MQVIEIEVSDDTYRSLRVRAQAAGGSMQQIAAQIVAEGAASSPLPVDPILRDSKSLLELADRIAALSPVPVAPDSTPLIRADRDRE